MSPVLVALMPTRESPENPLQSLDFVWLKPFLQPAADAPPNPAAGDLAAPGNIRDGQARSLDLRDSYGHDEVLPFCLFPGRLKKREPRSGARRPGRSPRA